MPNSSKADTKPKSKLLGKIAYTFYLLFCVLGATLAYLILVGLGN